MTGKLRYITFCIALISLLASMARAAEDVSTYLIMGNIPPYQRLTEAFDAYSHKLKTIPGYSIYNNSGILAGANHFSLDHTDTSYETDYQSDALGLGATVQVTQHAGGDSDKWLLHEVDKSFRTSLGVPGDEYDIRVIDGNTIMTFGAGGWSYRWLSGNKVIHIQYTDLQMEKPEPLEVVKAYLLKHPSTLQAMTSEDLRTSANKTKWIKDEMDRRLWLCDKWFEQLGLQKTDQKTALPEVVKSMHVFLDYREKYYGLKAADEKNTLQGYLGANDETNIRKKLREYKTWWAANKTGSFVGVLSVYTHKVYNHVSQFFGKVFILMSSLIRGLMAIFG